MTKHLDEKQIAYHTFTVESEKTLKVVIRNLPQHVKTEEINDDLKCQGFNVIKVSRMVSAKTKKDIPLVFLELPRKSTNIYNIETVCGLCINIEALKRKTAIGQCHRCQKFGHSQANCHAVPKCVKCGQDHITNECNKPKETPATCANCGGPHPASYKGCAQYPKFKFDKANNKYVRLNGVSYATALKSTNNAPTVPSTSAKMNVLPNIQPVSHNSQKPTQSNNIVNQSARSRDLHKFSQEHISPSKHSNESSQTDIVNILTKLLSEIISAPKNEVANLLLTRLPSIIIAITQNSK